MRTVPCYRKYAHITLPLRVLPVSGSRLFLVRPISRCVWRVSTLPDRETARAAVSPTSVTRDVVSRDLVCRRGGSVGFPGPRPPVGGSSGTRLVAASNWSGRQLSRRRRSVTSLIGSDVGARSPFREERSGGTSEPPIGCRQ